MLAIVCIPTAIYLAGSSKESIFVEGQKVQIGDILYTKIDGAKVQVLDKFYKGKIECRVASGREYRDGVVSMDSYTREYITVYFMSYELTWECEEISTQEEE